jgi:hypothetical protein
VKLEPFGIAEHRHIRVLVGKTVRGKQVDEVEEDNPAIHGQREGWIAAQ